ncbi:hypothetical protein GTQ43_25660 [Nostoc sp. KVJ3]|nr:hypothetical protein [Nostoc sp. KVJ3]
MRSHNLLLEVRPFFLKLEKLINNVRITVWEKSDFWMVTNGEAIPKINSQRWRSQSTNNHGSPSGINAVTPIFQFRLFSNRL